VKFLRIVFEIAAVLLVGAIFTFFIHDTLQHFQGGSNVALDEDAYRRVVLYLVLTLAGLAGGWLIFKYAEERKERQLEAEEEAAEEAAEERAKRQG
jgi:hypothetical protein